MIQTFLTVKWVQMRLNNELSPEKIVTFFVQWIDPTRTYDFDEVELKVTYTVRPMCRGSFEVRLSDLSAFYTRDENNEK